MAFKLTKIDDLTRGEHYYLDQNDVCYFFGEYTSRQGYAFSETNQLIFNFKKSMLVKDTAQWPHKIRAIQQVSQLFRSAFHNVPAGVILVPAPPSKAPNDPMYDDRMYRALTTPPLLGDVRKLIYQVGNREPSHTCDDGRRPGVDALARGYRIEESRTVPPPKKLVICDDVITSGATFKAMQRVLEGRFPGVPIIGIFVARRAPGADNTLSAGW